jgi:hypothetical protein
MILYCKVKIKPLLFFIGAILLLGSCKKDAGSVGADFVGIRNKFNTLLDTSIELRAYTVKMDSLASSKLTAMALGRINDPEFGVNNAAVITQFSLPGNEFSWGGATKLDSVVLQLRFRNTKQIDGTTLPDFYGNKDAVHLFKVYLLTEDIRTDSVYYANRKYKTDGIEMGSFNGKINFTDSVPISLGSQKIKFPPHIRIPMNNTFKNLLFEGESKGLFSTNSKFKETFKGLVIVDESATAAGEGAIVYLRLTSDYTSLNAYYKDSLAAAFPIIGGIRGSDAAYNYYYQTDRPIGMIQMPFSGTHRDKGYVQSLNSTKLRIEIPNLANVLNDPKIALNGAEILFTPLAGSFNDTYTLPSSISLVGSDSAGRNIFLKDQFSESGLYYGGTLVNNSYKFNIVRHLQNILNESKAQNGFKDYGMNLIIRADDPVSAQRIIFDTRRNNGTFKLKLTYTVIN